MMRIKYIGMHEIRKITDEYIYIIDSNQGKSITNDPIVNDLKQI